MNKKLFLFVSLLIPVSLATAACSFSRMGSAMVRVEQVLAAALTGAGSIQCYGHPHVEQNVTGAGSIKAAE